MEQSNFQVRGEHWARCAAHDPACDGVCSACPPQHPEMVSELKSNQPWTLMTSPSSGRERALQAPGKESREGWRQERASDCYPAAWYPLCSQSVSGLRNWLPLITREP